VSILEYLGIPWTVIRRNHYAAGVKNVKDKEAGFCNFVQNEELFSVLFRIASAIAHESSGFTRSVEMRGFAATTLDSRQNHAGMTEFSPVFLPNVSVKSSGFKLLTVLRFCFYLSGGASVPLSEVRTASIQERWVICLPLTTKGSQTFHQANSACVRSTLLRQ